MLQDCLCNYGAASTLANNYTLSSGSSSSKSSVAMTLRSASSSSSLWLSTAAVRVKADTTDNPIKALGAGLVKTVWLTESLSNCGQFLSPGGCELAIGTAMSAKLTDLLAELHDVAVLNDGFMQNVCVWGATP